MDTSQELERLKACLVGKTVRLANGSKPMHVFDIFHQGFWPKPGQGPLGVEVDENNPIYWAKCMRLDEKDDFNVTSIPLANLMLEPSQDKPVEEDGRWVFVPKGFNVYTAPEWASPGTIYSIPTSTGGLTYTTSTKGAGMYASSGSGIMATGSGIAFKTTITSSTS